MSKFSKLFVLMLIGVTAQFLTPNIFAQVEPPATGQEYRYQIIGPANPFPQMGPWQTQQVLYETLVIDGCTVKVVVEWSARFSYAQERELYISRLSVIADSKECFDKIEKYKFQIIDKITLAMASKAKVPHIKDINGTPTTIIEHWGFNIKLCDNDIEPTVAFRLYVNSCGYETLTYDIKLRGDVYTFAPCNTSSFCRIKYSYCYRLVNGKLELVEKVTILTNDNIYPCPPEEEYYDEKSKSMKWRTCLDKNCELRKSGTFIINTGDGGINKPDRENYDLNTNDPMVR